ncbi:copper resistance protein NlpE [Photobacterium damselae]|uniref:copper resistance protein NlpE n=1 Tax=Photobacterium damselae TaxID=38293 RepID=UPI0018A4B82C|nr:copper resistance protein NlpE [Photobacterium damselae]QOQ70689.1 copper resistance protein NlpE N-terminal domain-containing protein [Photobacterium damselae subsp. damselae]
MKVKVIGLALAVGLFMVGCDQQASQQSAAVDQHNAQNSLDWPGSYTGILPCADCSGIETILDIKADGNYTLDETYQGKKDDHFVSSGVFTWNKAGNTISLKSADGKSDSNYFVGENRLFRLDKEGNRVTGPLADNYSLKKQ